MCKQNNTRDKDARTSAAVPSIARTAVICLEDGAQTIAKDADKLGRDVERSILEIFSIVYFTKIRNTGDVKDL